VVVGAGTVVVVEDVVEVVEEALVDVLVLVEVDVVAIVVVLDVVLVVVVLVGVEVLDEELVVVGTVVLVTAADGERYVTLSSGQRLGSV
jgi:hypothetical protein